MKRILKYVILGLLMRKNMSGYEILKSFNKNLNEFWSAKHSQLYPELKKLTEENLIFFTTTLSENSLEKKIYSITSKGKEEFLSWLNNDFELITTIKDEFKLQLFFSNHLSLDKKLNILKNRLEKHQLKLKKLRIFEENFKSVPNCQNEDFGDYLVLLGAIMREETNCKWLQKCIKLCLN